VITYRRRLLLAAPLCAAFITLVGATPIGAQSPAAPAKTDKNAKTGPLFTSITDGLTVLGPTQASTPTGDAVEARGGDSNRVPKPERGLYLHPDALDQPAERSILRVQPPR
jgi:hypothetical protein